MGCKKGLTIIKCNVSALCMYSVCFIINESEAMQQLKHFLERTAHSYHGLSGSTGRTTSPIHQPASSCEIMHKMSPGNRSNSSTCFLQYLFMKVDIFFDTLICKIFRLHTYVGIWFVSV